MHLRDVVRCCIHGVDRNPMAVELARVALWIETVEPGKPLGFLDANIRVGDSLLGIFDLEALRIGIPDAAYKPLAGDDRPTARDFDRRNKRDKGEATGILDFSGSAARPFALPPLAASLRAVRELPEDTVEQIEAKRDRFQSAHSDPRLVNLAQAADLYISAFLTSKTELQSLDLRTSLVPTTGDVWTAMRSGTVYGPRLGAARQLANTACAFHWPLEFPDVMANGGFDVVLGNPPWERIKIQEQEFFAQREPAIAESPNAATRGRMIEQIKAVPEGTRERILYLEFQLTKRIAEASSEFVRFKAEQGGRFPLTGRGDVNTYALFAELFAQLTKHSGRAGIILPTQIVTAETTKDFFGNLMIEGRISSFYSFFEIRQWFPDTDDRNPFGLLTIGISGSESEFAFFLTDVGQISMPEKRFTLSASQIAALNPNTKTAPVFRSRKDAELATKIYSRIPILIDEASGETGNPWKISFMAMFHMANDSGLFRTKEQLYQAGYQPEGTDWILQTKQGSVPKENMQPESIECCEGAGKSPERYVPIYEAKMVHQFDHRWATYAGTESREVTGAEKLDPLFEPTPRYWVPEREVTSRLAAKRWNRKWLVSWRDICRSTDERTVITSGIPIVGAGHTCPLVLGFDEDGRSAALLANFNALILDFIARMKIGGTHLTYNYLKQFAILPPTFSQLLICPLSFRA